PVRAAAVRAPHQAGDRPGRDDQVEGRVENPVRPRRPAGGAMTRPRILVAGVGNIFLGDDAFGVEVARRLARRPLPPEVRVVDFGIRGLDLTYALLDGYETVVLVDAAPRGGPPGTLYVLEPEPGEPPAGEAGPLFEMHSLDPVKVLRLAAALGGRVERLL